VSAPIRANRLPGSDELFRPTGVDPAARAGVAEVAQLPAGIRSVADPDLDADPGSLARRATGRERHDEKITVYVSDEELFDLEQARLILKRDHGLKVDRGRIVRAALAEVLGDLEMAGPGSRLVARLREG
jgi:hypothetical protein